jgi:hypothetical protein
MKAWIGKTLFLIGIVHTIVGIAFYKAILGSMVDEGLFGTISISGDYDRDAAFWFLFAGFMLMIIGALINWFENHNQAVPKFVEWSMTIITIVGIVIMPASGFWLLILPIFGLFYRRARIKAEQ